MKTIYKYPSAVTDTIEIYMPAGAQILTVRSVDCQTLCIWAMVDTEQLLELRSFRVYGTGHPIPDNPGSFIGTIFVNSSSPLVFHIFEEVK